MTGFRPARRLTVIAALAATLTVAAAAASVSASASTTAAGGAAARAVPASLAWIQKCGAPGQDVCMILEQTNSAGTHLTIFYAAKAYGFTGYLRVLGPAGARQFSPTRFWPANGLDKALPAYWSGNFTAKAGYTFCVTGWDDNSGLFARNGRVCVRNP